MSQHWARNHPCQKFASRGVNEGETSNTHKSKVVSQSDESNIHIAMWEGSQGRACMLLDNLGSEEIMKSNEQVDKRNDDSGNDDSYDEKKFNELRMLASSIEEQFIKAQRDVAWLKERRAIKQRNIAEALLDLGVVLGIWVWVS